MEYVYVGKVVNTHGIKGEIRIKSFFEYKDRVFIPGSFIYIGEDFSKYKIITYRVHKDYDMVTLEGFNNINDVLFLLKKNVYVKKEDLSLDGEEYLIDDLIGFNVYMGNNLKGAVSSINLVDSKRRVMNVDTSDGVVKVPFHKDLIEEVNLDNKKLILKELEGLF